MTIEVRQLLIKATVNGSAAPAQDDRAPPPGPWLDQLREDLLAECKALVEDRLQRARER